MKKKILTLTILLLGMSGVSGCATAEVLNPMEPMFPLSIVGLPFAIIQDIDDPFRNTTSSARQSYGVSYSKSYSMPYNNGSSQSRNVKTGERLWRQR